MEYLILRYPDPAQGYILYTDASRISWSGILMQEHTDDKGKSKNHPICYVSGQFCGSQLNWAALMKEAYAIYMSIKRLSFYVTDADITIRSDHLPLKKFLNKQTMNSKVNNWAVELEQFRLHLEWIPDSRNLLADSLSCLIDVIPDAQQPDEPKDHEFGSYCFKELEPAREGIIVGHEEKEVVKRESHTDDSESSEPSQNSQIPTEEETFVLNYEEKLLRKLDLLDSSESSEPSRNSRKDTYIKITEHEDMREITLALKPKQLQKLQKNDTYCRDIAKKLHKDVFCRKYSSRKKEFCTGFGLRMEGPSNASWFPMFYRTP